MIIYYLYYLVVFQLVSHFKLAAVLLVVLPFLLGLLLVASERHGHRRILTYGIYGQVSGFSSVVPEAIQQAK